MVRPAQDTGLSGDDVEGGRGKGYRRRGKDGTETEIPCDSVISSIGYIPNPLRAKGKNVYLIGDCDKVGNLRTVIWSAYEAAMKIK